MKTREWTPFAAAAVLLVLVWALLWIVGSPIWMPLVYVGWAVLPEAMALIALPLFRLPGQGQAPRGAGVTPSTAVVTTGIYVVIRHPLYLGWMLAYVAVVLISQHWLVALVAVAGIASAYSICAQEDRRLLARFGKEHARYKKNVPRVNLVGASYASSGGVTGSDGVPGDC